MSFNIKRHIYTSVISWWSDGLSCPPNHPRSSPYRDFDAWCKTSRLRARKRLTPWTEGWVFAQSPVLQDVSERPQVFGLDKQAAAADEASSGNAAANDTVAAGWLGKGCGAHGVRALRLLHRATQGGKQGLARTARCRNLAYQRWHPNVCRGRPGALVSDGRVLSGL